MPLQRIAIFKTWPGRALLAALLVLPALAGCGTDTPTPTPVPAPPPATATPISCSPSTIPKRLAHACWRASRVAPAFGLKISERAI